MKEVNASKSDLAWLVYDLELDKKQNIYKLARWRTVYTQFKPALLKLTTAEAGPMSTFVQHLQEKLNQKLEVLPETPGTLNISFFK